MMQKGLIGAAAAAVLLVAGPTWAQPAPGSVCDFVQGAVIEAGEHFVHFKGTAGTEPETFNVPDRMEPEDASCAVIDKASTGENFMLCAWREAAGVSEKDARAHTSNLIKEVGDCLGSGRKQRPAPGGADGVAWAEDPVHDRAQLTFEKGDDGSFESLLIIYADP